MPVQIPQVRRKDFNDETIGMGFNSETGLAIGTALEGFTVSTDPDAPGQEVDAEITIISSHEEFFKKLGMSFEAQGRYSFFQPPQKYSSLKPPVTTLLRLSCLHVVLLKIPLNEELIFV